MDRLPVVSIASSFVLRGLIHDEKISPTISDNSSAAGTYWVFNGCLTEIAKGQSPSYPWLLSYTISFRSFFFGRQSENRSFNPVFTLVNWAFKQNKEVRGLLVEGFWTTCLRQKFDFIRSTIFFC